MPVKKKTPVKKYPTKAKAKRQSVKRMNTARKRLKPGGAKGKY